jgi:hypothetical protein
MVMHGIEGPTPVSALLHSATQYYVDLDMLLCL